MNHDKAWQDSRQTIRLLSKLGSGGTILDLGANIGLVSEAMLDQYEKAVCVEAHPQTFSDLRERLGNRATLINNAVSSVGGVKMFVSTPTNSIGASARPKARLKREGYYQEVESVSFQSLLDQYDPRVVKMDIEGSEFECLESFKPNKSLSSIQVEWHGTRHPPTFVRMTECELFMQQLGFARNYPAQISMTPEGGSKALYFVAQYSRFNDRRNADGRTIL